MSPPSIYFRSFIIGSFYGAFLYVLDRCLNIKGPLNVAMLAIMSSMSFFITIAMIKIPKESRFYKPMKPLALIGGFIAVTLSIYAFLGSAPGQQNFVGQLAESNVLPPALQTPLRKYIDWGSQHRLIKADPLTASTSQSLTH